MCTVYSPGEMAQTCSENKKARPEGTFVKAGQKLYVHCIFWQVNGKVLSCEYLGHKVMQLWLRKYGGC